MRFGKIKTNFLCWQKSNKMKFWQLRGNSEGARQLPAVKVPIEDNCHWKIAIGGTIAIGQLPSGGQLPSDNCHRGDSCHQTIAIRGTVAIGQLPSEGGSCHQDNCHWDNCHRENYQQGQLPSGTIVIRTITSGQLPLGHLPLGQLPSDKSFFKYWCTEYQKVERLGTSISRGSTR